MENPSLRSSPALAELVAYLFTRREAILNHWRTACEQDPTLTKISVFSRQEFNNLIPIILDILEQRLLGKEPEADPAVTASSHGLHRWQKSHDLLETMQELDHLTKILYNEVEIFQQLFPQTDAKLLLQVQEIIRQIMQETIQGSVKKYDELQRLEAANRASALQVALDQMAELSRQRGDMLKTSSHDLRSSFGLINSAAYLLKMSDLTDGDREKYLEMLNRNLNNVQSMLTSLMDLSRLEAGEEPLHIESLDVAPLLREMVTSAQPMATQKGLVVRADGPDTLLVDTDPIKLKRVVQNLLINALQYTPTGFISVSWSRENDERWMFGIQDSGPGLNSSLTSLFAKQLRPTVEPTSVTSPEVAQPVAVYPSANYEVPTGHDLAQLAERSPKGEGVGLQIVKRLCELLGADMEIETHEGRGTLFRVRMPIHRPE